MTDKPFLTIFIPVYNAEKYLDDLFATLKNQTCRDFEVFFCDDCSTDRSQEIIRKFIDDNSGDGARYILYKAEKNRGSSHFHFSEAFRYLNGTYLIAFTQDDCIDADFVERCRQKSMEDDYDIILSNLVFLENGKTRPLGKEYLADFQNKKLTNRDMFELSLNWKVSAEGCIKLDLLKKAGYFDYPYYTIDEFATRKALLMTDKIAYVDVNCYYRIDNPNALTKKMKPFSFDALTTNTWLADLLAEYDFGADTIEKQIEKLVKDNNWFVFKFFENIDDYSVEQQREIREKLTKAHEKIASYLVKYKKDPSVLYDLEQVENGVLYKSKGLPYVFEIQTYRKRENKIRAVKLFGLQIAKWIVKKKRKKS